MKRFGERFKQFNQYWTDTYCWTYADAVKNKYIYDKQSLHIEFEEMQLKSDWKQD